MLEDKSVFLILENFFWPLQVSQTMFIFLRPRIKSIHEESPKVIATSLLPITLFFFFHYDDSSAVNRVGIFANQPSLMESP
jgi:hypothetical protein